MIAKLKGTLAEKTAGRIVVEIGGVGYEVWISLLTFYDLPDPGASVSLFIHTHVREDTLALYGFLREEEKRFFEQLIAVSKIGPKLALNILSGLPIKDLKKAIRTNDVGRIKGVPGVGTKTAERLVMELRDKVGPEPEEEPETAPAAPQDGVVRDAVSALMNLGYKRSEAEKGVSRAFRESSEEPRLEDLLKSALKFLSPG